VIGDLVSGLPFRSFATGGQRRSEYAASPGMWRNARHRKALL